MLHHTCDLCGQKIEEKRFVTRVEVYPAFDPDEITEEDLDRDNLSEISEMLADMELTGELNLDSTEPKSFRFDLCQTCCRNYAKDPLGRHRTGRMRFSEN